MRRAFTLVELLVVILIIAILISLLMPAVGWAKRQAGGVKCASNLRQIAMGWKMYADSNKGVSCPARMPTVRGTRNLYDLGQGPTFRPRWYEILAAQTRVYPFRGPAPASDDTRRIENELFLCPTEPEWRNSRNYVYGYNFQFLGNTRPNSRGKPINSPVSAGSIRADTVLAADCMGTAAGKSAASRKAYKTDGGHDVYAVGNHGYTLDPPRLTASSDYSEDNYRTPADRSAPDPRHGRRANVAFCDGHVEALTLDDLGYVVRPDGSVAATDPKANNRRFSGSGQDKDPPPAR